MSTSLVNAGGRAGLRLDDRIVDVANASDGRFSTDPMEILGRWSEFRSWAAGLTADAPSEPVDEAKLGPPVTTPQKIFGVGLNYTDHAEEARLDLPKEPLIFTKFPNCLVGPRADVVFTSNRVDYEVELVVVIGSGGRNIDEGSALDHVAGYCVGQDISDRRMPVCGQAAAVLDGEVGRYLRPDRSRYRVARRARRSERSRNLLRRLRRAAAGRPDEPHGVLGAGTHRLPLEVLHARPRRPDLHWDARRRRIGPRSAPLPRRPATRSPARSRDSARS